MKACKVIASIMALLVVAAVSQERLLPPPPACIYTDGVVVSCVTDQTYYYIQNGQRREIQSVDIVWQLIGRNGYLDDSNNGTCNPIRKCPIGTMITDASQVVPGAVATTTAPRISRITPQSEQRQVIAPTPPVGGSASATSATASTSATTKGCPTSALVRPDSYYAPSDSSATLERLFEIDSTQACCAECANHPPCSYFIYCKNEAGRCYNFSDDYKTCRLFSAPANVVNRTSWSKGVGNSDEWDAGYLNAS